MSAVEAVVRVMVESGDVLAITNSASTSQTMLGVQDRAKALPDAVHLPNWNHSTDDPRHPSQVQLNDIQEQEHYGKIKLAVLRNIRQLSERIEQFNLDFATDG
jgi:hypothetical protein